MAGYTLRIIGFADACLAAMDLADTFRRGHAAAVTDGEGELLDLTMFTGERHTIHDALDWATGITDSTPQATRVLLLSVTPGGVRDLRDDDLQVFRHARAAFARREIEVLDWIQSDGETMRSLAFTEGIDTWGTARR